MIAALTLLLVFQLAGEVIARALALPIPGPVIGMALLFLALLVRGGPGEDLRQTSGQLLQHLSLLFVPAGTGIVLHLTRVGDEWLALLLSLLIGAVLALIVVVFHNGLMTIALALDQDTRTPFLIAGLWFGGAVYTAFVAAVIGLFRR